METEKVETVIHGTFPAQRFFNILAMILSNKYNLDITVKVTQEKKQQDKESV